MRIVIVAPGLWHAPEVADALVELGHSVQIVGAGLRHSRLRTPVRALRAAGRIAHSADAAVNLSLGLGAYSLVRDDVDLALCWSSFAAAAVARGKSPVVVVRGSHHIRTQQTLLKDGSSRDLPSDQMVRLEEWEYARASLVTVPTDSIADDPAWTDHGAGRPAVTPYGFPKGVPQRSSSRQDSGLRLIFGGALTYRKGIDRLADALATKPGGVESFELFGATGALSESINLPGWWKLRGQQPRAAWRAALVRADALLLPSREEGMARVGQEALAAGVPIIVTPESGLDQWLSAGGGMVLPGEAWADGLQGVLDELTPAWPYHHARALAVAGSWTWRQHAELLLEQATEASAVR